MFTTRVFLVLYVYMHVYCSMFTVCIVVVVLCVLLFYVYLLYSAFGTWWYAVMHGRESDGEKCEWIG